MLRPGLNLQIPSPNPNPNPNPNLSPNPQPPQVDTEAIPVPHFLTDVDRKSLIYMQVSPRSWLRSRGKQAMPLLLEVPSRHNNKGFLNRNQWAALLTWVHHQAVRPATNHIGRPRVEYWCGALAASSETWA